MKVAQSCPTLCDPMDYGPPASSVHGILQAIILKWVAYLVDLPNLGVKPGSPALQEDSLPGKRSVQFNSVTQSCPTLCNPMNHSTPGRPVHHQLPEFTQTHVHQSVMPSSHLILCHPAISSSASPSPPAPNPSQHQSLFQ